MKLLFVVVIFCASCSFGSRATKENRQENSLSRKNPGFFRPTASSKKQAGDVECTYDEILSPIESHNFKNTPVPKDHPDHGHHIDEGKKQTGKPGRPRESF